MPMYDLLEYGHNYSMTSGSLWNNYRDEVNDVNDNVLQQVKSFGYKRKIRPPQPPPNQDGSQPPQPPRPPAPDLKVEVTIPLKYLSNFWSSLDLLLI